MWIEYKNEDGTLVRALAISARLIGGAVDVRFASGRERFFTGDEADRIWAHLEKLCQEAKQA